MRILHIVGSISPACGGPTEAIRMLIRYAPVGYTAEVVTLDDPDAPFLRELPFPVQGLGRTPKRWFAPALLPWLKQNRERFDGVVVHGLWEYTGLAARLALAGRLPYVVFPHGMLDPYFKHTFPRKHRKKWLYWLWAEYWVLRRAARVLFTTAEERDLAAQSFFLHRWQSMVVPLGTEPPPSDKARLQTAFKNCVPAVAGKRFLLFLGRIDPKKGCDLLLEAFAAIASQASDLHLVMAGPDPKDWTEALRAIASRAGVADRVHWPGMLRGDAKWGAFDRCDAFILPSHQENFGIAAVEALAAGKAVLLAKPVNIAPDLERAGCALVEPDTREGTLRLIERWLALPETERLAMGRRALATFQQSYDMRHNTEAILRVFETLVPSAASPVQPTKSLKAGAR